MQIRKIELEGSGSESDLTVWFEGNDEPWQPREFIPGSPTSDVLYILKERVGEMMATVNVSLQRFEEMRDSSESRT
jgi:hypothetical protein